MESFIKRCSVALIFTAFSFNNSFASGVGDPMWKKMALIHFNLEQQAGITRDYKKLTRDYLRLFDFEEGNELATIGDNEIEVRLREAEIIDHLNAQILSVNPQKTLIKFNTDEWFGEYNFEKERFHFKPLKKNTYFYELQYKHGEFPEKFKAVIANPEFVDGIDLDPESANNLLKKLKSSSSTAKKQRKVSLQLITIPVKFENENKSVYEIVGYRVFERDNYRNELFRRMNTEKIKEVLDLPEADIDDVDFDKINKI